MTDPAMLELQIRRYALALALAEKRVAELEQRCAKLERKVDTLGMVGIGTGCGR